MKKLVVLVMLLAFAGASLAIAAGKDVVVLENKKGNITFQHKKHQEYLGGDCSKCHEGTPAKIEVDRNFGHKTCRACHKEMKGNAPTRCNGCHKK